MAIFCDGEFWHGKSYAEKKHKYKKYWVQETGEREVIHVIGKGIGKFHIIYWPAILLSAGLDLPTNIFIHGYLTMNGEKISKSLGNVIDPDEVVNKRGIDATRYFLLGGVPAYGDGDFSMERMDEFYTSHRKTLDYTRSSPFYPIIPYNA